MNLDSSDFQPQHWSLLAHEIHENYEKYDGFVVTHGTDTLSYTASALSFALGPIGKPVVLTGAQLPFTDLRSDAKNNLVNAFRAAAADIGEVVVVFGDQILRGNRSTKKNKKHFNAFYSPNYPKLGDNYADVSLDTVHLPRSSKKPSPPIHFEPNVVVVTITPGLNPHFFIPMLSQGVKGCVLRGYGLDNLPIRDNSFLPFLELAKKQNIPVILSSQCMEGMANFGVYKGGALSLEAGAIPSYDMTLEAMVTKLMWILGQTNNMKTVKKLFTKNIVGELSL